MCPKRVCSLLIIISKAIWELRKYKKWFSMIKDHFVTIFIDKIIHIYIKSSFFFWINQKFFKQTLVSHAYRLGILFQDRSYQNGRKQEADVKRRFPSLRSFSLLPPCVSDIDCDTSEKAKEDISSVDTASNQNTNAGGIFVSIFYYFFFICPFKALRLCFFCSTVR